MYLHCMYERKINRLSGFDYSSNGYYFVTICTKERKEYFGKIVNRQMILNQLGGIIKTSWLDLTNHYRIARWINILLCPITFME